MIFVMVNYTKRAVRGAGITLIMSILAAIIAYVTRMILARNLGPYEYGLFSAVFTFVIFLLFFRDLGLRQSLSKYIAEFKANQDYDQIKTAINIVFLFQLFSSLIFVLILYFLSDYLAINYFKDINASLVLKIFLLYVLFSIFFIVLKGIFQGFQKMFLFSSVEFSKNLIILILILILFQFGFTLLAPIIAYALVGLILFMIYLYPALNLSQYFKYNIINFKITTKKVVLFGIPLLAASFAGKIIGYIDTLLLTYFGTLTEVGIYNVVLPTALILLLFGRSISAIIFPMASELWAKKDSKRINEGLRLIHKYAFIILIPLIFSILVYSQIIIRTFFGSEYGSGYLAMQILLVGIMFFIVAMINNQVISALGKPRSVAKIIAVAAFLNIVLNLFLIPKYGINGAAIATSISYFLIFFLSLIKLKTLIGINVPFFLWIKHSVLAVLFVIIILTVKSNLSVNIYLEIITSVLIASLIYFITAYLFDLINIKEIRYYLNLLK